MHGGNKLPATMLMDTIYSLKKFDADDNDKNLFKPFMDELNSVIRNPIEIDDNNRVTFNRLTDDAQDVLMMTPGALVESSELEAENNEEFDVVCGLEKIAGGIR